MRQYVIGAIIGAVLVFGASAGTFALTRDSEPAGRTPKMCTALAEAIDTMRPPWEQTPPADMETFKQFLDLKNAACK